MRKILVAIDGSPCALRAVDYTARQFSGLVDVQIMLFHVLPYVPAVFWDDGHILSGKEKEVREKIVERWLSAQAARLEPLFREAVELLLKRGIPEQQITARSVSDSSDTASSILEEARTGGYQTVVMGRCGHSQTERRLTGSVTAKVLAHGAGAAVCVVE